MPKASGAAPGQVWAAEGPLHLKASAAPSRAGLGSAPGEGSSLWEQGDLGATAQLLHLHLLGTPLLWGRVESFPLHLRTQQG